MKTQTVEYSDDEYEIRLVVQKANTLTAMKKSILVRNNMAWLRKQYASGNGAEPDEDTGPLPEPSTVEEEARRYISQRVMPDLLCCVVEVEGIDLNTITPEQFMDLPDALTDAWEIAVYTLNRHWLGIAVQTEPEDEDEDPKADEPTTN